MFPYSLEVLLESFVGLVSHKPFEFTTVSKEKTSGDLRMPYFCLSISAGQIAGSTLLAQSSSPNMSLVAARAISPALRACTNGSLIALVKAAIRTLDLVWAQRQH